MRGWSLLSPLARIGALTLAVWMGGCAGSPRAATVEVGGERYEEVFSAAERALRRAGFTIERVDARAGVITTRPKSGAGLGEPWEGDDTRFGQEVDSLLHHQRRRAIVRFEPAEEPSQEAMKDLRTYSGPLRVRVAVLMERVGRPGTQIPTTSVRLRSQSRDPTRGKDEDLVRVIEEIGEDPWLAGRLADRIGRLLETSDAGASASSQRHFPWADSPTPGKCLESQVYSCTGRAG